MGRLRQCSAGKPLTPPSMWMLALHSPIIYHSLHSPSAWRLWPLSAREKNHKAEVFHEGFAKHNKHFEVVTWLPNVGIALQIEHQWNVVEKLLWSMTAPACTLLDSKALLLNMLVPDTAVHLQGCSGVCGFDGSGLLWPIQLDIIILCQTSGINNTVFSHKW